MAQRFPTAADLDKREAAGLGGGAAERDRIQAELLKKAIKKPGKFAAGGTVRNYGKRRR